MSDIRNRAYGIKDTGRTSITQPESPPKRKRGRPTNAEREARKAAEAMQERVAEPVAEGDEA